MGERLWIARVELAADRRDGRDGRGSSAPSRSATLRCATTGAPPGPDDLVEAIADPFQAARERGVDPVRLAREASSIDLGVEGRWGEVVQRLCLAPPVQPSKIIGVGRNYRAHAEELGNAIPTTPLLFFKPPSCLVASGAAVRLPRGYERVDMEAELVVVIGARAREVAAARAWEHVAGLTLGNDISCRDLQRSDGQWTRAKGFDGFGPIGPWIRLQAAGEALPAGELRIRGFLDDQPIQDGRVADMIFPIQTLIEHISACMTLEAGDLLFTGTPAGVAPLRPGQVTRVEFAGLDLGRLTNPLV